MLLQSRRAARQDSNPKRCRDMTQRPVSHRIGRRSAQVCHCAGPASPAAVPRAARAHSARAETRGLAATQPGVGPGIHVPHLPGAPGPSAVGFGTVVVAVVGCFCGPIPLDSLEFGSYSSVKPLFLDEPKADGRGSWCQIGTSFCPSTSWSTTAPRLLTSMR